MLNICAVTKFCIQTMIEKVLRHFHEMAPFLHTVVDISIPPTASPGNTKSML